VIGLGRGSLCTLKELADPDSRGFEQPGPDGPQPCFLIRRSVALRAGEVWLGEEKG
jgi:hypothetical protein